MFFQSVFELLLQLYNCEPLSFSKTKHHNRCTILTTPTPLFCIASGLEHESELNGKSVGEEAGKGSCKSLLSVTISLCLEGGVAHVLVAGEDVH
jgi:hypothetical protein